MKEAFIAMAILGCDDDGRNCQTVQRVESLFESVAACRAASAAALEKLTELAYPVIVANCEKSSRNALAEARPLG